MQIRGTTLLMILVKDTPNESSTIPHSLGATLHDRLYQRINIYRCQIQIQLYTICRVVAIDPITFYPC